MRTSTLAADSLISSPVPPIAPPPVCRLTVPAIRVPPPARLAMVLLTPAAVRLICLLLSVAISPATAIDLFELVPVIVTSPEELIPGPYTVIVPSFKLL